MGDTITRFDLLKEILEAYQEVPIANAQTLQQQLIADRDNGCLILTAFGWQENIYRHQIVFHFELKGDRI
ncbi:MAG: element excision factor XisI family protein [Bacteroidota bacterium]